MFPIFSFPGFPLRKAAYQALDTLVDVAFSYLDPSQLVRELSAGLTDQDDIIMAAYQILYKLSIAHPVELCRVLDTLPQKMMVSDREAGFTRGKEEGESRRMALTLCCDRFLWRSAARLL